VRAVKCLAVGKHNSGKNAFGVNWSFVLWIDRYFGVPKLHFIWRDRLRHRQPGQVTSAACASIDELDSRNLDWPFPRVVCSYNEKLSGLALLNYGMPLIVLHSDASVAIDNERRNEQTHDEPAPIR